MKKMNIIMRNLNNENMYPSKTRVKKSELGIDFFDFLCILENVY